MKKLLFALLAVCCMAFTSCMDEAEYTITYVGGQSEYANVTAFEYSGSTLVAKYELKNIMPDVIYPVLSSDSADCVVIGVEAVVANRISEWYCSDIYYLDPYNTTDIVVDFTNMPTTNVNPMNPNDRITHYIYKK